LFILWFGPSCILTYALPCRFVVKYLYAVEIIVPFLSLSY
jgi:hypothetical protein